MSDNLAPEVVQQVLEARLRIPTEVWTDVFKLLPRRVLVQQVAPICYYFKEISDKNIKSIHVIESANQFTDNLNKDDTEAKKQVEHLTANKCNLAGQFRLSNVEINEKNQAILRHCPDLFKGCAIELDFKEDNKNSALILECLSQLEEAKPVEINVDVSGQDQVIDFWHHPTFLNCSRIDLFFNWGLSAATMMNIFDWLHHQPNGVDCDASADQQVRCMIVWLSDHDHIDWLIKRCSENIQQGREPIDRRPYVLSFCFDVFLPEWTGFDQFRRIENKSTGEVLVLDRVIDENGEPTRQFRLRRCLAKEEASGQEFYAGVFKRDEEYDEFKTDEIKPSVMIGFG